MLSKRATCGARPTFGLCSIISQVRGIALLPWSQGAPGARRGPGAQGPKRRPMTFAPGGWHRRLAEHRAMDERIAPAPPGTLGPFACASWPGRLAGPPSAKRPASSRRWDDIGGCSGRGCPSPGPCSCVPDCHGPTWSSSYCGRRSTAPRPTSGCSTSPWLHRPASVATRSPPAPTGRAAPSRSATALLLDATDELHRGRVLTASTWERLRTELDDREVIELCMLVGHYEMLAMTLNSLGVRPERSALGALDEEARRTVDVLAGAARCRDGGPLARPGRPEPAGRPSRPGARPAPSPRGRRPARCTRPAGPCRRAPPGTSSGSRRPSSCRTASSRPTRRSVSITLWSGSREQREAAARTSSGTSGATRRRRARCRARPPPPGRRPGGCR